MTGKSDITASRMMLAGVGGALALFVAISPVTFDGASVVKQSAYAAAGGNGNGSNGGGYRNSGSVDGSSSGNETSAANANLASVLGSVNAAPNANANERPHPGALANYIESLTGSMEVYLAARDLLTAAEIALAGFAPVDPEDLSEAEQAELEALREAVDLARDGVNATLSEAAGYLGDTANKGSMIDANVVDAVNSLLDGKSGDFEHNDDIHDSEEDLATTINP